MNTNQFVTITEGEPLQQTFSRRTLLKGSMIAIGGLALASCSSRSVTSKEVVELTQEDIMIPHLPPQFEGMTVTLASDFHSSPYMSPKDLKNIVSRINELKSDVILLPGDFVTSKIEELPPIIEAFSELRAKHGVYASTGNHDHDVDCEAISQGLEEIGITMLRNENRAITIGGEKLHLLGIDDDASESILDFTKGKYAPHIDATFKGLPENAATILLCHRPYQFDAFAQTKIGIMLSGHTHGGQIVLARIGRNVISLCSLASNFVDGFYDAKSVGSYSRMYVSRGLGVVDIPYRLNCPPEITQFTLHSPVMAKAMKG